jgi:hypothetical protein
MTTRITDSGGHVWVLLTEPGAADAAIEAGARVPGWNSMECGVDAQYDDAILAVLGAGYQLPRSYGAVLDRELVVRNDKLGRAITNGDLTAARLCVEKMKWLPTAAELDPKGKYKRSHEGDFGTHREDKRREFLAYMATLAKEE